MATQAAEIAGLNDAKLKYSEEHESIKTETGLSKTGEILSLASSAENTIASIHEVVEVFSKPNTADEKFWTVIKGLRAMADVTRSVIAKVETGSGVSTSLLQAIPGLGLAIAVVSLADTLINTVTPLCEARGKQKIVLEAKNKKKSSLEPEEEREFNLDIAAFENILSATNLQIVYAFIDVAASITMIVGQAMTLAVGPFGAAVTALGGALMLGNAVVKTLGEWWSSSHAVTLRDKQSKAAEKKGQAESALVMAEADHQKFLDDEAAEDVISGRTAEQRSEMNKKKPQEKTQVAINKAKEDLKKKKEVFEKAEMTLMKSDKNTAFKHILDMFFDSYRIVGPVIENPELEDMLKSLGVTDLFIRQTIGEVRADHEVEVNYRIATSDVSALLAVGEPMELGERFNKWKNSMLESVPKFFKWSGLKLGMISEPKLQESEINEARITQEVQPMMNTVKDYVVKKEKTGENGVKQGKLNYYLQTPYLKLLKRMQFKNTEAETKALKKLEDVLKESLTPILRGADHEGYKIDISTLKVKCFLDRVEVSYKDFQDVKNDAWHKKQFDDWNNEYISKVSKDFSTEVTPSNTRNQAVDPGITV